MTYKRVEHLAEGVTLYQGDMMDVLPTLGRFDACVTDPPYGIGEASGKAKTRTSGKGSSIGRGNKYVRDYGNDTWDDAPISDDQINSILEIAKYQIIFGGNYYNLGPTSCWLVWDKLNGDNDFADCELAWTNLKKAVRRIKFLWCGCMRQERHITREHPTQKPVGVMDWCIGHLPPDVSTIIGPFMGSGTTGVAAVKRGKCFTGIERESKYFDIACRRIEAALKTPDMFVAPRAVPEKQETFI